jgi:peptidoglycan hydrolase-like protein with peptidoglycan-binding domain
MTVKKIAQFSLVAATAACCGVIAASLVVAPQSPPSELDTGEASKTAPISTTSTTDPHDVQVQVVGGQSSAVRSATSGVLTASVCKTGSPLVSGNSSFSIDGVPIGSLATATPLWRDLRVGDHGDDVEALQRELSRLGFDTAVDGLAGRETANAARAWLTSIGGSPIVGGGSGENGVFLRRASVAWLPSQAMPVQQCSAVLGAQLSDGSELASLQPVPVAARVASMPETLPGKKVLVSGGTRVILDGTGNVTDPSSLATLLSNKTDDPAAASDSDADSSSDPGSESVAMTLRLAAPIKVWSVPAAGLYGFSGNTACVETNRGLARVRVVGSRLASSIVIPQSGQLGTVVRLSSRGRETCS